MDRPSKLSARISSLDLPKIWRKGSIALSRGPCIQAFGKTGCGTDGVYKSGQMAPDTKETGKKIRLMGKEHFSTLMATCTRENGHMTRQTDKARI